MLVLSCFPHSDERGGVGLLNDTVSLVMWETPTSHVEESLRTEGSGLHTTRISDTRTDCELVIICTVPYTTLISFFVCSS